MITIFNDDCFNILPTLEKNSIDLVIADLPYGITDCKWDSPIDLKELWKELLRIGKERTPYIFFCTTKFGYSLIESNKKMFRYDLVWEKHNAVGFLLANKMPLRRHEMMYVFYKKLPTYNPQFTPGKPYSRIQKTIERNEIYGRGIIHDKINETGDRHPTSVLKFNYNKDKRHPTQKPIELLEWIIKSYSNEDDTVLDPTMGSGSTGLACKNTNRKFIGIEKDEEIFKNRFVKNED